MRIKREKEEKARKNTTNGEKERKKEIIRKTKIQKDDSPHPPLKTRRGGRPSAEGQTPTPYTLPPHSPTTTLTLGLPPTHPPFRFTYFSSS